MKYEDVAEWEYDDTEGIMVAKLKDDNGNTVDILYVDELISQWLEDMKDKEFEPVEVEE